MLVQSLSSFGSVFLVKGLSCGFPLRSLSSRVQGKRNQLYLAVSPSMSLRNGMYRLLYLQVRMFVKFLNEQRYVRQHPKVQTRKHNLLQFVLLFPRTRVSIVNNCLSFLLNLQRLTTRSNATVLSVFVHYRERSVLSLNR